MVYQMFHIMSRQVLGIRFGCCCHNGSVFEVDNLCGFENICFGGASNGGRKKIGNDREIGKCLRCVLCEISLCFRNNQITDRKRNTSGKPFEKQAPCRACCRKYCGIEHAAIEKDAPLRVR